jgi:hypothetical protein
MGMKLFEFCPLFIYANPFFLCFLASFFFRHLIGIRFLFLTDSQLKMIRLFCKLEKINYLCIS